MAESTYFSWEKSTCERVTWNFPEFENGSALWLLYFIENCVFAQTQRPQGKATKWVLDKCCLAAQPTRQKGEPKIGKAPSNLCREVQTHSTVRRWHPINWNAKQRRERLSTLVESRNFPIWRTKGRDFKLTQLTHGQITFTPHQMI